MVPHEYKISFVVECDNLATLKFWFLGIIFVRDRKSDYEGNMTEKDSRGYFKK